MFGLALDDIFVVGDLPIERVSLTRDKVLIDGCPFKNAHLQIGVSSYEI